MTEQTPATDAALAARIAALDLVSAVLSRRVPFDDAWEGHRGIRLLEARDRAFVRLLCATVLRRLGQIDACIAACLDKPGQQLKAVVQDILRLGAAQLLFLNTPAHAAVDTGVELAIQRKQHPYKGLINAVLRRLARDGQTMLAAQDAGRLNTPDWLWLAWRKHYGTGPTRAIVESQLNEAPLDITVKGDAAAWAEKLGGVLLPTGSIRRPAGGQVMELPGFDDGVWWVQDAAAAIPARLFGDLSGKQALDLCAAPGGKTAQLAAAGAQVTAVDRSDKRLLRLTENMQRLGFAGQVTTVVADATEWRPEQPADAVLLDAPCSATGTIRRHPDVARLKDEEDVEKLGRIQSRMLYRAVDMLKPGGVLVYCTCSLQPEEGEVQITNLLYRRPEMKVVPVTADEVGGMADLLTPEGFVRCHPGHLADQGGMDGFFAARLKRTA
ncbi:MULTISPECIES: RsmB/NOP family class I SAM-dependent RNA methyltransferase [unclassified Azospirillum]|uniref:RsmB/NOP family class I SAM-dependent RNA methyltransferase n=1 Tax=unclassified Azospirillum TaxID=2630922 RepID=UPI000B74B276|nr:MULTISPECIES: transcription antitermination factor NusB [unclassified Azospirillum]SNS24307.1 16S rRNA (cytosine967-C5)-methyltransferase [Azospirillum sp. RU38E]SNS42681.1 16S rRNA (cytosine967-C5)-methyltransferase [Azospirillum sp. RU37A]